MLNHTQHEDEVDVVSWMGDQNNNNFHRHLSNMRRKCIHATPVVGRFPSISICNLRQAMDNLLPAMCNEVTRVIDDDCEWVAVACSLVLERKHQTFGGWYLCSNRKWEVNLRMIFRNNNKQK